MYTRRLLIALALFLGLAAPASAADAGVWVRGASMNIPHFLHSSVLLDNGRVLVVGGSADVAHAAEVYDPATDAWTFTGPMHGNRDAVAKLANGKVLAASGTTAEVYDPATNVWTPTGPLPSHHDDAMLIAVGDRALLAGGRYDTDGDPKTLEFSNSSALFNPSTNAWTDAGNMPVEPGPNGLIDARAGMTGIALPSGEALVSGGVSEAGGGATLNSTALYTVSTGWMIRSTMNSPRAGHTLTLLPSGKVLAVGGTFDFPAVRNPEVYDPVGNGWSEIAPSAMPRGDSTATLVDGKVLVAGGVPAASPYTELYDPVTGLWSPAGNMSGDVYAHAATALRDGRVLVSGGTLGRGTELWAPLTFVGTDSAVVFDETGVGSSASGTLRVTNFGTAPMFPADFAIGGETPAAFSLDASGCRGPVAPGGSCPVRMTFAPSGAGTQRATLTFIANSVVKTYSVPLSGRGFVPAVATTTPPATGSPEPSADRDGDGVIDASDRCGALAGPSARLGCPSGLLGDPSIAYRSVKGGIRVVAYFVKATTGARVVVKCSRGCMSTVTTGRGAKRVRIARLSGKRLTNGTKITITVSLPGRLTTTVTDTIKRGRRIEGRPVCAPVAC